MRFLSRYSLTFSIACILLATSTLVLGVSGMLAFRALSHREQARLKQEVSSKTQTMAEALVLPIWNFDEPQISRLMETFLDDPTAVAVTVRSEGRTWTRSRQGASPRPVDEGGLLRESREIPHTQASLGTLEVVFSTRLMEAELGRTGLFLIFGILAFDLVLVVGLYLLIWRTVVHPIQGLERYAEGVSSGERPPRDVFTALPSCLEMGNLRHSIKSMVDLLDHRYATLMESEQRFRALFNGSNDAVYTRELSPGNPRTPYLEVNDAACRMLGYTREEFLGMCPYDISAQGFQENVDAARKELLTNGSALVNTVHVAKDGHEIPVEVSAHRYEYGGRTYIMSSARDVSERMRLEEQLRHSQKMESLGLLAGGIAHDFNNLLQVITSYADMLNEDLPLDSPAREKLDQILTASQRASQLTRGLLTFSRKQSIEPEPAELNALVRRVGAFLKRVIGEDIRLIIQPSPEDLGVFIDQCQIEQVMMNLATNARDAMPKGGTLRIQTERVEMDAEFVSLHGFGSPGSWACISVSDTGLGMDEATRQRIFDPFYLTKPVGKGTGLGLSIVYGILQQHRAHINVYSEPGIGTTFRIYLPIHHQAAPPEDHADQELSSLQGRGTILLAEDEEAVRTVVTSILEGHGYTVVQAKDGLEAVERCVASAGAIDLLLMDIIMPRMSGREAFSEIRSRYPGIPVIFTSGYPIDIINDHGELGEDAELILKPVAPRNLLQRIRQRMGRA